MKLQVTVRELHPRRTFRIARARRKAVENVFLRLEKDGLVGWGEASPNSFYGETAEDVARRLEELKGWVAGLEPRSVEEVAALWEEAWPRLAPSRAAQGALDLALWDWVGQARGQTAAEMTWGEAARPVTTFGTLGLSAPEEWPEKLAELAGFAHWKVKSDAEANLTLAEEVARRGPRCWAVDANASWRPELLPARAERLAALRCHFLEQPLPPAEDGHLRPGGLALPTMADESCVVEGDVERCAAHFDGFNVKLVKCGGLTPAVRMVRAGRAVGRQVMVGCMLESSVLIAAGCVAAQGADFADLDGAWLLGDDPAEGWAFAEGVLSPPAGTGLGVRCGVE